MCDCYMTNMYVPIVIIRCFVLLILLKADVKIEKWNKKFLGLGTFRHETHRHKTSS